MRGRAKVLVVLVFCVLLSAGTSPAVQVSQAGKLDSVTVYRGQALVTRAIVVNAPAGPVDLVVGDLPVNVRPDSLYANTGAGFEVRAVRFVTRVTGQESQQQVRQLDQQIEAKEKELRQNERMQEVQAAQAQYLAKLEGFVAPTAQVELTKGVLNAETLKTLTGFTFQERTGLATKLLELEEQARVMKKDLELLQKRRQEFIASGTTQREAVVFIDKPAPGNVTVRLSYLVSGADWAPNYILRAAGDRKQVRLEYAALVSQTSGEDWSDVELTLSTAAPSLAAQSPELGPLWVGLGALGQKLQADEYLRQQTGNLELLRRTAQSQRAAQLDTQDEVEWTLNDAANRMQSLELAAPGEAVKLDRALRKQPAGGLSATYKLPARVSLASRDDRQMLQIAAFDLPSDFYHTAVPVLSTYVYQQADLENTSPLALLGGPSACYVNGEFVGQGSLPMVAQGQKFTAGFGIDPQLAVTRELVAKDEKIQGGNKELTFKYRLVLENFKNQEVNVRLMDRLPKPKDADLRVTLGTLSDPLSADALYLRTDRPNEILRWDVAVAARAAGPTARTVEYEFKIEFDKNMQVTGPKPAQLQDLREELKQLKERRQMH